MFLQSISTQNIVRNPQSFSCALQVQMEHSVLSYYEGGISKEEDFLSTRQRKILGLFHRERLLEAQVRLLFLLWESLYFQKGDFRKLGIILLSPYFDVQSSQAFISLEREEKMEVKEFQSKVLEVFPIEEEGGQPFALKQNHKAVFYYARVVPCFSEVYI